MVKLSEFLPGHSQKYTINRSTIRCYDGDFSAVERANEFICSAHLTLTIQRTAQMCEPSGNRE